MKNEYLTYSEIDLSLEPDFIDWVKKESAAKAWESWQDAHPEMQAKVEQARELVLNIQFKEIDTSGIDRSNLWNKINTEVTTNQVKAKPGITRRLFLYVAAAASVALLTYFFIFQQGTSNVNTLVAQQKTEQLPDGSSIQLNALSSISYEGKDWSTTRRVQLKGEAFFQVEKGNAFIVETDLGTVEVLGTSFNVFARENDFEVMCTTGKVRVRSKSGNERILTPGEKVNLLANGELSEQLASKEIKIDWLDGLYKFRNKSIGEVVKVLERQFDVKINIDRSTAMLTYTGSFETKSLEQALYSVFWPLKLQYAVDGKKVTVQ